MKPIDFYTYDTPNGKKIWIALEEMGLPYKVHSINIYNGEQHAPEYRAIHPGGKIPVITDPNGPDGKPLILMETGAILLYLAEKTGKFMPKDPLGRMRTIEWVIHQAASQGPMLGQASHFLHFAPKAGNDIPYGKQRYAEIAQGIYSFLEQRVKNVPYLAGAEYTVADMAAYPWLYRGFNSPQMVGINPTDYPALKSWVERVGARPAVQRGMTAPGVHAS